MPAAKAKSKGKLTSSKLTSNAGQFDILFSGPLLFVPAVDRGAITGVEVFSPVNGHPIGAVFVPGVWFSDAELSDPECERWPPPSSFTLLDPHSYAIELTQRAQARKFKCHFPCLQSSRRVITRYGQDAGSAAIGRSQSPFTAPAVWLVLASRLARNRWLFLRSGHTLSSRYFLSTEAYLYPCHRRRSLRSIAAGAGISARQYLPGRIVDRNRGNPIPVQPIARAHGDRFTGETRRPRSPPSGNHAATLQNAPHESHSTRLRAFNCGRLDILIQKT